MSDRIRIIIVDDHPLFREGVAHTLAAESDLEVVGQGATASDALRLARDLLPDIVLLDIGIPGRGLNAAQAIAAACPVTKIVMLTVSEEEDDVLAALKAGAQAYVLKGVAARDLVSILRAVHAGEVYVTPTLAARLLVEMTEAVAAPHLPAGPLDELTARERQVLELVAAGSSNKEVGQRLHLTEKTVKHYMTNILQKLQVRNRVEAALLALRAVRKEHESQG
ncbi:MAG: response regulator transcription factor [Chloroflexi bacterium]|nr:response regulator transcription factor [Chloroflexota bacterium]